MPKNKGGAGGGGAKASKGKSKGAEGGDDGGKKQAKGGTAVKVRNWVWLWQLGNLQKL